MRVLRTSVSTRSRRFVKVSSQWVLKPGPWRPQGFSAKPKLLVSKRRVVGSVLILVGGILCSWVAGNYAWMYWKQRVLLQQWNTELATREALTKLFIPRIHLEDVVLEGTSSHSLLLGPAHLEETPEPGADGNSVIAGHRDTFFRHIHKLHAGDNIYVLRDGHSYHYIVTIKKIVLPTDLSVLKRGTDPELTLITCYPTHAIGPAPERLVLIAKLARSGAGTQTTDLAGGRLAPFRRRANPE